MPSRRRSGVLTSISPQDSHEGAMRRHGLRRVAALAGGAVVTYFFPTSEISFHDILSPEQPYQRTDLVYPKVLALTDP